MTKPKLDDLLLLPDDAIEYTTLDTPLLFELATQRYEPFLATSALCELSQRQSVEARDAAVEILRGEGWDRHLTAYALTTLFADDPDAALGEMLRMVPQCTDPTILAAMTDNVLSDRERFDVAPGLQFATRLAEQVQRVEPDKFTDLEERTQILERYSRRTR